LAYTSDKAGIVSAISYSSIIFSTILGLALGDSFPDWLSLAGIACIITSGIVISMYKKHGA